MSHTKDKTDVRDDEPVLSSPVFFAHRNASIVEMGLPLSVELKPSHVLDTSALNFAFSSNVRVTENEMGG
uniref:Uncharacterized protein n=1 Tax=viral metagenome TaxID=1070528 RepID=A0A6M3JWW0_9ZZZZ